MSDINAITITGRLGAEPEVKFSQGGEPILRMRVAVSGRAKKDGQWGESTTWLGVTVFGKRGESLGKMLHKGSRVGVSGRLEVREYERKDGGKGTSVEIVANDVALLGGKRDNDQLPGGAGYEAPAPAGAGGGDDDDAPF